MAAIAVAFALIVGANTAISQCVAPGPIRIINNSSVPVNICLQTTPQIACPVTVASGATVNIPIAGNTVINGVFANSGTPYGWIPPGGVPSVDLDGSGPCFDVIFTPNCTVTITMSAVGPPCTNS